MSPRPPKRPPLFPVHARTSSSTTLLPSLFLLLLLAAQHPAAVTAIDYARTPSRRIAFSKWAKAPAGWELYHKPNATRLVWSRFIIVRNVSAPYRMTLQAAKFTYVTTVPRPGPHRIRIGLLEPISDCMPAVRTLVFTVNGVKTNPPIDLAADAGCQTPYNIDLDIPVAPDGLVTISASKQGGSIAPIISNFQLYPALSNPSPSPSPAPVVPDVVDIVVNVGAGTPIPNTTPFTHDETAARIDKSQAPGINPFVFKTGRIGPSIELSYDLPPGIYDVTLGFVDVDTTSCAQGSRVFNVAVNGRLRLEGFDIFDKTGGCLRAVRERFLEQAVDPLNVQPFTITLTAVSGDVTLSFVRIKASKNQCVPAGNVTHAATEEDHFAHAVPGRYPPNGETSYIDREGKGWVTVKLDGTGSHTHFSDSAAGIKGRLRSYRWTNADTDAFLSNKVISWHRFYLGTTRVRLTVVDNACSRHEAITSVTVTGTIVKSVYCYFYKQLDTMPGPGTLYDGPDPDVSMSVRRPNFEPSRFPYESGVKFVMRCLFFVEYKEETTNTEISVITDKSGQALVYDSGNLILDTNTSYRTGGLPTASGLQAYEVMYSYDDVSVRPKMIFRVNGSLPDDVFYDRAAVRPIITSILPKSGRIDGGARTVLRGYGLFQPLRVHFGGKSVMSLEDASSTTMTVVFPPSVSEAKIVDVRVETNSSIRSNALQYEYGSSCDPIKFERYELKVPGDGNLKLDQPTSVAMWNDGKLYIGTRRGVIKVIGYDAETLEVTSMCHSEVIVDERYVDNDGNPSVRSILGIAFNPKVQKVKPYVAVSTLFWERQKKIRKGDPNAWRNGAVLRFKGATAATMAADSKQCLQFERVIVDGLPVSDGDHSVNEMVFTQRGDLLIAVGGNTNAGLPHASLGGNWETYLSGAVVVARTAKGGFNGTIDYTTPDNLRTAKPKGNDVDVYATGMRNLFSMAMTRSGRIYGVDMGPNCDFGNVSMGCDDYNVSYWNGRGQLRWGEYMEGKGNVGGEGSCKYGDDRPDKLIEIKKGQFYGHPNIQRSLLRGTPGECVYVDPLTGRGARPTRAAPPGNYEHWLTDMQSPTTGVREYGSNLFCGQLRGDLILSRLEGRNTYRARLKEDGMVDGGKLWLHKEGGMRVEENVHGDLLFPGYSARLGVVVLRPVVKERVGMVVVNALPFRHGRKGGMTLMVGGWGFGKLAEVYVGGVACPLVGKVAATELRCMVPAHAGGARLVDVRVVMGAAQSVLADAVLYMLV